MDFNRIEDLCEYLKGMENDQIIIKSHTINFKLDIATLIANFPKNVSLSFIDSTFIHTVQVYSDDKIIYTLNFDSCVFQDEVNFSEIEFLNDLNITKSTFIKEVSFFHIVFHKYFRLNGSTFNDIIFFDLTLSDKSFFYTNDNNRPTFKGNVRFHNVEFQEANFWDFTFQKDVEFVDTCFICPTFFIRSKFLGKTVFESTCVSGNTQFLKGVYFNDADISDLSIQNITIENVISFSNATIKKIFIKDVYCDGALLSFDGTIINSIADEGTARFLKTQAIKSNNPFLFSESVSREMNLHYQRLKWRKSFFDKLIFFLNKHSTNFGERWQRGILFIMLTWIFFFSLTIILRDGFGNTFIWSDKTYLKEAINYLWQFGNLDVLGDSFGLLSIIIFILGKIMIIYGVYQTITAFRKYGKR